MVLEFGVHFLPPFLFRGMNLDALKQSRKFSSMMHYLHGVEQLISSLVECDGLMSSCTTHVPLLVPCIGLFFIIFSLLLSPSLLFILSYSLQSLFLSSLSSYYPVSLLPSPRDTFSFLSLSFLPFLFLITPSSLFPHSPILFNCV